jgi:hypothetical protein
VWASRGHGILHIQHTDQYLAYSRFSIIEAKSGIEHKCFDSVECIFYLATGQNLFYGFLRKESLVLATKYNREQGNLLAEIKRKASGLFPPLEYTFQSVFVVEVNEVVKY